MRRTLMLMVIFAAALNACQSGPAQSIRSMWGRAVHPCPDAGYSNLVWSPDSSSLAYTANIRGLAKSFTINVSTHSTVNLKDQFNFYNSRGGPLAWSVDGKILLDGSQAAWVNVD